MSRSLASQMRVKTARHLLNIVALNREIETYNVDGLLKAASVGQSKESCLRYAGLHAALLLEKQALASLDGPATKPQGNFNFGPSTPAFKANNAGAAPVAGKPNSTPRAIPGLTTEVPGLSRGRQLDISAGTTTEQRNRAIAAANANARQNLPSPGAGGVVGNNRPPEQQGILDWNFNGPNRHSDMPDAPTKGLLRDRVAGTDTASRLAGVRMAGTNVGGGKPIGVGGTIAGTNPNGGIPEGVAAARAAGIVAAQPSQPVPSEVIPKPTYTEDPVEAAYSKQLNEGAAASAAAKQQSDEDAYMKSIEPNAPTYPVSGATGDTGTSGPAATPASEPSQAQGGFQRQKVIGSGAPIRTMIGNIRNRRGR